MARTIWRYKMKPAEQKMWDAEGMEGWRKAFEGCVEDDARDQGMKKYMILDRKGQVVAKNAVKPLPQPQHDFADA